MDNTMVLEDRVGKSTVLTLNRPEVMNSFNLALLGELKDKVERLHWDPEVRVIIITGAGDKAFCAGADLGEFLTAPPPVFARQARFERDIWGVFLSVPQPLIAALHGYVLGSGLEIALFCDIRIASDDTRFSVPEMGLGIITAAGASQTLPRAVNRGQALEMLLSGRWVDAPEARSLRLVNQVVPRSELMATAQGLAERVKSLDHLLVRNIKEAVGRGVDMTLEEGLELEARLAARTLTMAG